MSLFFKKDNIYYYNSTVFQRVGDLTYHSGHTWKAEKSYLEGSIKSLTGASTSNAHIHVYLCADSEFYGTVGYAYVGTLCKWKTYQCSINEKRSNTLTTAEVCIGNIELCF